MKKTETKEDGPELGETLNNPLFKQSLLVGELASSEKPDEQPESQANTGLVENQISHLEGKK